MADEVTIRVEMNVLKDNLDYRMRPNSFSGDMNGAANGPSPGAVLATVTGTNVDFSQLTTPAYCRIQNLDTVNYVEVGIWDGLKFYPLLEILPGETYPMRLSRNLTQEFGTGTGTTGSAINQLQIRAYNQSCNVLVEAFPA